MPTQVVCTSVLARPVHPILPNIIDRGHVAMCRGLSSAADSWAWVLRALFDPFTQSRQANFGPFGAHLGLQNGHVSRVGAENNPEWERGVD